MVKHLFEIIFCNCAHFMPGKAVVKISLHWGLAGVGGGVGRGVEGGDGNEDITVLSSSEAC